MIRGTGFLVKESVQVMFYSNCSKLTFNLGKDISVMVANKEKSKKTELKIQASRKKNNGTLLMVAQI